RADADDVVQEAMLRAYRAFDSVRGSDVKPWLLTIVRNCCMSWTSGEKRRTRGVQPIDEVIAAQDNVLAVPLPDPEAAAVSADEGAKLAALVQALPEEFRTVLILREWEDMSYKEIAEVTGIPIGTVMSRLARARALLKDAWFDRVEGGVRHAVR